MLSIRVLFGPQTVVTIFLEYGHYRENPSNIKPWTPDIERSWSSSVVNNVLEPNHTLFSMILDSPLLSVNEEYIGRKEGHSE